MTHFLLFQTSCGWGAKYRPVLLIERPQLLNTMNLVSFSQLKITSKVKADVQNISGELIVSGLDSATSLIQVRRENHH